MDRIKWYTQLEIVDIQTGEIITKSEYERRNLKITNKTITNEYREKSGIKKIRWECKEHEQFRLFD